MRVATPSTPRSRRRLGHVHRAGDRVRGRGAFVSIWPAGGDPEVIDGNVEMPGRGLAPDSSGTGCARCGPDYGGGLTLYAGHGSVATPGAFAALGVAHERHGVARGRRPGAERGHRADGLYLGIAAASYLAITGDSRLRLGEHSAPLVRGADGSSSSPAGAHHQPRPRRPPSSSSATGCSLDSTPANLPRASRRQRRPRWPGHRRRPRGIPSRRPQLRCASRLGDWDVALNPPPRSVARCSP